MEKPMIYMEHVTKKIGGNVILQDVNLNLEPGCVYGIEGTNGSGKTMLMRMIAGLIYPTQGKVLIQGKEISGGKAYPVNLGMLIENPAFLDGYTGLNNLKFLASINQRVTEQEIRDTITRVGLDADDTRKYKKYSLGMKQRIGIAAAIFEHPDILILDEPVDGLDPVMRRQIWSLILQDVTEHGTTVLVSSHNLRELEDVCDHVGIMNHGKIIIERSLSELQSSICKIQAAFQAEMPKLPKDLEVLHMSTTGRVHTMIVRGEPKQIKEQFTALNPMLMDVLPLSLEEIFIYELGGADYAVRDILF